MGFQRSGCKVLLPHALPDTNSTQDSSIADATALTFPTVILPGLISRRLDNHSPCRGLSGAGIILISVVDAHARRRITRMADVIQECGHPIPGKIR
jgi:hypothetical protein